MPHPLDRLLNNGANTPSQLQDIANALGLSIRFIGSIFDLKYPLSVGNYIVLITPDKKTTSGHWVALKIRPKRSYYFDSYGQPPPRVLEERAPNLYHNRAQIQSLNETHCGIYALYFLKSGSSMLKHFRVLNRY